MSIHYNYTKVSSETNKTMQWGNDHVAGTRCPHEISSRQLKFSTNSDAYYASSISWTLSKTETLLLLWKENTSLIADSSCESLGGPQISWDRSGFWGAEAENKKEHAGIRDSSTDFVMNAVHYLPGRLVDHSSAVISRLLITRGIQVRIQWLNSGRKDFAPQLLWRLVDILNKG